MARRSDHTRDELKALILNAGWKIIGEEGREALTARRVASEIGYAAGTVYNLFEDMDDLILQLNLRTFKLLYEAMNNTECHNPQKTPVENAKQMARLYMQFARDYKPYWMMLFTYSVQQERYEKESTIHQQAIDGLFTIPEKLLQPLFPSGKERDLKIAARSLWASIHGMCFLYESGKFLHLESHASFEEMSTCLIETFFKGLKV